MLVLMDAWILVPFPIVIVVEFVVGILVEFLGWRLDSGAGWVYLCLRYRRGAL